MAEPRVQYAKTSDGVSIAWVEAGQGPALLVCGGTPWTHVQASFAMWVAAIEALTQSFRHVSFDARGTGMSERDVAGVSAETLLLDAEAAIDAAKPDRFVVVADPGKFIASGGSGFSTRVLPDRDRPDTPVAGQLSSLAHRTEKT